jgi:hypothetical protein
MTESVFQENSCTLLVRSRETIKSRPSLLDLDVPISVHPAPDNLGSCLAFASHVDVVMAALMDHS